MIRNWHEKLKKNDDLFEIIICNDGSTDRTFEIIKNLEGIFSEIKVVNLPCNQGYGSAIRAGLKIAQGEWIATIDSDGQFEILDVLGIFKSKGISIDAVFGFRGRKKDNFIKFYSNILLDKVFNLLFQQNIKDPNCAIKVLKRDFLRQLNLTSNGFTLPTEVIIETIKNKGQFDTAQVSHYPREFGVSKLRVIKTSLNFVKFLIIAKLKWVK